MPSMSRTELIRLARTGAAHRLAELQAEMAAIRRQFPGITTAASSQPEAQSDRSQPRKRRRRRNNISPEGRKRISEMMKKRWAERRKAKARAAK